MPGAADVMTEYEDLLARTESLIREFEPSLSARIVVTTVRRCRNELTRTGVRRGLAIAAEAMARSSSRDDGALNQQAVSVFGRDPRAIGDRGVAAACPAYDDQGGETAMTARAITAHGLRVSAAAVTSGLPEWKPSPVTGGQLLALAMSLRARGLRGLDVLRRSRDRGPPSS
jgi:hypothetical protein